MADPLYHVTFSKNLPDIQERGLDPLSPSLWRHTGTGERYQDQPSVFSFQDPEEALRWAWKMEWEFRDDISDPSDISIVKLRGGDKWESDPAAGGPDIGKTSMRSLGHIPSSDVLDTMGLPLGAGINEEFQRQVPGGDPINDWLKFYGNRLRGQEPRTTAPDQPNLPVVIDAASATAEVSRLGADDPRSTDYLSRMNSCLKGNYSNCKLAVQQTLNNPELTGNRIKVSEDDAIVSDWLDENSTKELEKILRPGDILDFNQRHYAIYEGSGSVVQVPGWGENPERISLHSVLAEWDPPTQIINATYEPRLPDQPNLPEVISGSPEEPDGRPKSKGRMVRGIGSLMRSKVIPLIQLAQMGYDLLPEDKKFAGDFIDYLKETKTHELFGMDKSVLDYLRDLFGMEQPEPEKSNESLLYDATTRAELFQELADQQRGTPEILMVEAQKVLGGGVLNSAIEHTGDLTHRIADKYDFFGGYGYDVGNKVDRVLRSLRSGYGFEKEFRENLRSNSRASGIPEERLRDLATEALQRYADAHKELRVYNEPQKWARDAAVALGEQRFSDAEKHLSKLQELIRGKGRTGEEDYMGTEVYQPSEDFRRANAEFDPQFEDLKVDITNPGFKFDESAALVRYADSPDTIRAIVSNDDEFALENLRELKADETSAEATTQAELVAVRRQIYEATQQALSESPDVITVYRIGRLRGDEPLSFTLDPNFSGALNLPWAKRLEDPSLQAYTVNKVDILAAPNAILRSGKGTEGELEVLIAGNKVSPVEFTVARPQRKASGGFVDKPLYDDARVGGLI